VRSSRVSAHTLRRSVATLLLNDGLPIDAVSDMLDHDRVDTTRKHYAFSSSERQRITVDSIAI
jgi:site-specific recombinase XerD